MIKEDNYISLYDYEIKKGKLLLFNFAFSKSSTQDNTYRLAYDIHFDNIERKFKNNENGLYAKGLLARIFSKFHQDFKITPLNEKQGFDFSLDVEFTQKITESEWINVFKLYREVIENILKNQKILLTRETINVIISYFESEGIDNSVEHMIVVDSKNNKIYEVKDNVDIQDDTQTIIESILKQNFSRIPVYDNDKDNVIGLIHTKRLLNAAFVDGFDNIVWKRILQTPLFVPETIFVDDLLKELRNTQNQMAILLDEYGGMAGLVTLEDLLEEIVGEIDDETDKAEIEVHQIGEDTYIVQGTMNLNDFNDYFDVELESDDVDTIAGYYLTGVGMIPTTEKLSYELVSQNKQIILTNDKVKNGRVTKVKVQITEIETEEETE
mgnify:CR=1 FL=1